MQHADIDHTGLPGVGGGSVGDAHGCRATRTSGSFSVGNNVYTAIAFTAEAFDTDTMHDPSTNNTRITIPSISGVTTGLWLVGGNGYFDLTIADLKVRLNGSTDIAFNRDETTTLGSPTVSTLYVFSATDYIELLGRTPGGAGNVAFDAGLSPIFWATFLGKVT